MASVGGDMAEDNWDDFKVDAQAWSGIHKGKTIWPELKLFAASTPFSNCQEAEHLVTRSVIVDNNCFLCSPCGS